MAKNNDKEDISNNVSAKKVWQIYLSFGLTIGISIYLLGFLFGAFLDAKFATAPIFTIIGTLLAIFMTFYRLFVDLKILDKKDKNKEN